MATTLKQSINKKTKILQLNIPKRNISMKKTLAIIASVMCISCATTNNFEEAEKAYETKDYSTAMQKFRIASEQGNSMASLKIGNMYDAGQGVRQNFQEAIRYYKIAARQGHPLGYVFVSAMYENGQGVTQNRAEAQRWKDLAKKCTAQNLKNCENLE